MLSTATVDKDEGQHGYDETYSENGAHPTGLRASPVPYAPDQPAR